jgi:UDP-3-O-[3-hydroxymyristoyl] glucosamine N-acyltransferase
MVNAGAKAAKSMKVPLARIAEVVQGQVIGNSDLLIHGVAPFELAGQNHLTVAGNAGFIKKIGECQAAAIIVPRDIRVPGRNLLQTGNPMVAFARAVQFFHPPVKPLAGIHPRAEIGLEFTHGDNLSIGPQVVIGHHVTLGNGVWLHPGVVIGDRVTIGNDVIIHPNVTIQDSTIIGSRVIIHSGTVIGSDGFGFASDGTSYHKIPHTGNVQIDDDVEIGANNAIDRGTFGTTRIGRGVKTDNLVHVAHNVSVGENTVLVAQVGISGSVTIGKNAILAGQAGVAGHLTIGDNATVGPQTGVGKPVPDGQTVSAGIPEMPHRLWLRVVRTIPKLPDISKRLRGLEKQMKKIEEKLG